MFTFGSLFSGIGGIDLGLERAGMECKWQVEIDDYCQQVLAKHWPDVQRFRDVKTIHGLISHTSSHGCRSWASGNVEYNRIQPSQRSPKQRKISQELESCSSCLPSIDLICGGFPCQPWSVAGKQQGEADDRNLWPDTLRVIREMQPQYLLLENVPGLIPNAYFDKILDDLEDASYKAWPIILPAAAFDAPHLRYRVFIVAYSSEQRRQQESRSSHEDEGQDEGRPTLQTDKSPSHGEDVADTNTEGLEKRGRINGEGRSPATVDKCGWWSVEPNVGRVAHGVPSRVDRLRALGNAVVPQVAEWIGRRILEHRNLTA